MDATAIIKRRLEGVDPVSIPELDIDVWLLEPGALHYLDFQTVVEELRTSPDQQEIKFKELSPAGRKRWVMAMMELVVACAYDADGTHAFANMQALEAVDRATLERLTNAIPFGKANAGPS